LIASTLVFSSVVIAAESATGAHPCATIGNASERLACYDQAFPPPSASQSSKGLTEDKTADARHEFGLNKAQLREQDPERDAALDRIEAKIVGLTRRRTGERVLTLDNHQIWLLTEVTSKGQLRVGDAVQIRTAALGSFMLITPARIPLRARRLQ
jgi:hypothetical protein